ncbi:MAG: hypothetical protein U0792_03970 [Gemmataceae bacterium]
MLPFHVRYTLTRRQRMDKLLPWLPALAGSLGFGIAGVYLSTSVTPWFVLLFLLPPLFYRGLFVMLFDLATRATVPVELTVDETRLWVQFDTTRRQLPLDGIIQVYRSDDAWTVLHSDNSSLVIPMTALTEEQANYLKSFALRALEERRSNELRN